MERNNVYCRRLVAFLAVTIVAIMLAWSPSALAQPIHWEQTNGPGGSSENIRCIVSDGSARLFTAIASGIYRSLDRGNSWKQVHPSLDSNAVELLAVDGDGRIFAISNNGMVLRSEDHGTTWSIVKQFLLREREFDPLLVSRPHQRIVPQIMIDNRGNLLVAGWTESYRSTDHGETWEEGPSRGPNPLESVDIIAIDSTGALLAVQGRCRTLYRSTNFGETWETATTGLDSPDCPSVKEIIAVDPEHLICIAGFSVIHLSTDGGLTWSRSDGRAGRWINRGVNGALYKGDSYHILRSTDYGVTWEKRPIFEMSPGINRVLMQYSPRVGMTEYGFVEFSAREYILVSQGIVRSIDSGKSWSPADAALPSGYGGELIITPDDNLLCPSDHGGLSRSTDRGTTWRLAGVDSLSRSTMFRSLIVTPDGGVYGYSHSHDFLRSTDGGRRFRRAIPPHWSYPVVPMLVAEPNGSILALNWERYAGRSIDSGKTWQQLDSCNLISRAYDIAFDSLGVMYAALTDSGVIGCPDDAKGFKTDSGVVISYDHGKSWVGGGLRNKGRTIETFMLAVSPSGTIYTSDGQSLWRSSNRGKKWRKIYGTSKTIDKLRAIYSIALNRQGDIFIAGVGGVARSQNNGGRWESLHDGIGLTTVVRLVFDSEDRLYAGTVTQGVYRTTTSTSRLKLKR
jgi:photosystem II stability/assembly factor-like uncharacterized protein